MDSAEVLPFRSAHLRACLGRTGRNIVEEGNDKDIGFYDGEAAELIEP